MTWIILLLGLVVVGLLVIRRLIYCPHCGDRLKYEKGPTRSMFFCMSCGYALWDREVSDAR